jgi:hypothetical protein
MVKRALNISAPKIDTEIGAKYKAGDYLPIDSIRTDGGTQAREDLDGDTVKKYAQAMLSGAVFPFIDVYYDGANHWLADGFHRLAAAREAGQTTIRAKVHQGDKRAAILHAVGANDDHGLHRTNADKRRSIETMLNDDEWRQWSDSAIAKQVKVDHKTVASVRAELYPGNSQDSRTVERGGTTFQQKVKQPASTLPSEDEQHRATIDANLIEAEDKGERTGTRLYQQAYDHAAEIHDLTLHNKMIALIDRATDTPPEKGSPLPAKLIALAMSDLDALLPPALEKAGYYWHSATPPTLAINGSSWRGEAPTVEGALAQAYDRERAKAEPIAVFPALSQAECKALIREAKDFIERGVGTNYPTIAKALRIAARMALDATK